MNIALWIVQILLAVVFGLAGFGKLGPIEQVGAQMAWVLDANALFMVRLPAVAEILGAVGLILPSALRIRSPADTVWMASRAGIGDAAGRHLSHHPRRVRQCRPQPGAAGPQSLRGLWTIQAVTD